MRTPAIVLAAVLVGASAQAASRCPPTPYSVAFKKAEGHLTVHLPAALGRVAPAATLGAEYNRSMVGAIAPIVVSEVLDSYDCPLTEAINADANLTQEQREALLDSWSDVKAFLNNSTVTVYTKWGESDEAGLAASPRTDKTERTDDQKALLTYIGHLPHDNFLVFEGGDVFGNVVIHGVGVAGCAGFVREALADNADAIQHVANAVRPSIVSFVSRKNGPRDAAMQLWTQASGLRIKMPSSTNTARELVTCKTSVAAAAATPAAAASAASVAASSPSDALPSATPAPAASAVASSKSASQ